METEQALNRLYDSFKMGAVEKNLSKRAEEKAKAQEELPVIPEPVDIYQRNQDRLYEYKQKSFPKGASAIVNTAVTSVIEGAGAEGLARAYKRAKDDSEALKDKGERGRAQLVKQQYMQEHFLPAVELVVNSSSPDELLSSPKALDELDKYALLEGSGKGYTATYVRQAYGNQLGQVEGRSDDFVRSGVRRINMLLDDGQVRTAVSMANNLKKKIENGEAIADDSDYDLIGRVVAYFN